MVAAGRRYRIFRTRITRYPISLRASPACRSSAAHQAISDAGLRDEVLRPRRVALELVPELPHVHAEIVGLLGGRRIRAPDRLEELAVRQHPSLVPDQLREQPVLGRRQWHLLAAAA